jgi:cytochrome P450
MVWSVPLCNRTSFAYSGSGLPALRQPRQPIRPAPKARPLVGHVPAYLRDRLAFFESCRQDSGAVARCRLGGHAYLLNDPEDIRHVLVGNQRNYDKARRLVGPRSSWLRKRSLLTSRGVEHRRKRRMIQPLFRRPLVEEIVGRARLNARRLIEGWRDGDEIEVADAMMSLAQRNILETLFDSASERLLEELAAGAAARRRFIERMYFSLFPVPEYLPTKTNLDYARRMRRVHAAVDEEIATRQQADDRRADMLSALIDIAGQNGDGMSDREVRDEVLTFSLTGYETVGEALTWTLFLLARHPQVEAKLASEVRSEFDLERREGGSCPSWRIREPSSRSQCDCFPRPGSTAGWPAPKTSFRAERR